MKRKKLDVSTTSNQAWNHVEATRDEYEWGHTEKARLNYLQALRDFVSTKDEDEASTDPV